MKTYFNRFFCWYKVKEQELGSKQHTPRSSFSANSPNRCVIGTYKSNPDPRYPNQRIYSATIPKDYFESVRNSNITNTQLYTIDQNIANGLSQIQNSTSSASRVVEPSAVGGFFNNSFSDTLSTGSAGNTESEQSFNMMQSGGNKRHQNGNTDFDLNAMIDNNSNESIESTIEIIERQNNASNKKNVSFNKDIDVRIFRKNSKNSKILESYMLPLPQQQNQILQEKLNQENLNRLLTGEKFKKTFFNLFKLKKNHT